MLQALKIPWNDPAVSRRPTEEGDRITGDWVGARIRSAYELAGFNRHSFAHASGISYTTLDSWEAEPGSKRHKTPKIASVRKVAEFLADHHAKTGQGLRVQVHDLLGDEPDEEDGGWEDSPAWLQLEEEGVLDAYRLRGVPEAKIQHTRRIPGARGGPVPRETYIRHLDADLLGVVKNGAEPAPATEAREEVEKSGGPDLEHHLRPKRR